jgi:hypothetical protein
MRFGVVAPLLLACVIAGARAARADRNDLVLENLIGRPPVPGMANDPSDVVRQTAYRSLMSELSVVMSPRLGEPADTLGYSGFQLSLDARFTQVTNHADYWQQGVEHVSGSWLSTINMMVRKGLWLPLPSLEIGVGGTKLIDSDIYSVEAYLKVALHEGYRRWPLPSIALKAAVAQVLGTPQVSLTVMSLDLTISKLIPMGGVVKLDPYLGVSTLLSFVRGQVIDTTPNIDAYRQGPGSTDVNSNATFPDPDTIVRWRLFTGVRLVYWKVALTTEVGYTLCNETGSSCAATDPVHVTDRSLGQTQLNVGASLLY